MNAINVLLQHSVDYAGLFPPAALEMQAAVDNYARYRRSEESWALGRFVLPSSRLTEFSRARNWHNVPSDASDRWPLAALAGNELEADIAAIEDFNRRSPLGIVDTLEIKCDSPEGISESIRRVTGRLQTYVEIPVDRDPAELLAMIRQAGGRAKVRTGGVTRDAFPSSSALIRFLATCVRLDVPFKATAGLHHPIRAEYRLTYAPNSEQGPMFGFLNLFLAAAFLRTGLDEEQAHAVLQEGSPAAFRIESQAISWKGRRLDVDDLRRAREVMISFGSCSFDEPVSELQSLLPLAPHAPA